MPELKFYKPNLALGTSQAVLSSTEVLREVGQTHWLFQICTSIDENLGE